MSLLTLFTIPKPFRGHIGVIQRNAIASWTRLGEGIDVVLCGSEEGTAEVAKEFGLKHVRALSINHYGTPYVDSAFNAVRRSTWLRYCQRDSTAWEWSRPR